MKRLLACALLLLAFPVCAQLLPRLGLPGSPAGVPQSSGGNPYDDDYDYQPRALKAWIDDEVLTKKKRQWKRTQEKDPLPWIGPGQRVEAWLHLGHRDEYGERARDEIRWHVGDRLAYPYYVYDYAISDRILEDPVSKDWNTSGETMTRPDDSSHDVIISPYRFVLISIEPAAVIMVPYRDVPKPAHKWNGPRAKLSAVDAAIDHGDIRYGTDLTWRDGMMYFDFDPKTHPQPLVFDEHGIARFNAKDAPFECTRHEERVSCERKPKT
jgi:hypothetical protein